MSKRAVPLLIACLLTTLGSTPAAEISSEKVIVALKPDKDPDRMLAERQALARVLGEKLGKPVEVIVPTSAAVILEGMKNGTIDLSWVSATEMVTARDAGAADLLLAGEINGQPYYESYWVSLKEKPYTSVTDLKGQPVAFSSRTSTSGLLIPLVDLQKRGLIGDDGNPETFFGQGNVWYGIGYVSAIERVLSGEAEAAAVSYYVLDEDKYLTAEQKSRLKKVVAQGPVPTHVIAVSTKVSAADREILKSALLGLSESDKEISDGIFSGDFVEVNADAHLAPVETALELIGRRDQ